MFALKVASAQTKASASSTNSLAHNCPALLVNGREPVADLDARAAPGLSWDFTKIPTFPRDRPNGSQTASSLFASPLPTVFQPKLAVGQVNDPLEHEADRVAEQVSEQPAQPGVGSAPPRIQRFSGQSGGPIGVAPPSVERALASPGRPLEPALRQDMEQSFGHDFSRVRVHTDVAAGLSAHHVNAHAYTSGYHIVMDLGRFAPAMLAGRRLLAHELTHVVQQTRESNGLQARLIQRKGPQKAGGATQQEKEALLNFKDDWRNYFSHYDKLIKISGRSFDGNQKEPIRVVKHGNSITIILGKQYANEDDEKIRSQWIKAEVIHRNVRTDRFEDIAYDPTHSKINEIAPPYAAGKYCALNCPATAASLDHYLRTGKISPAICHPDLEGIKGYGFDISMNHFGRSVSWDRAERTIRAELRKHGDFVIIEATRSKKQMSDNNLSQNHYFSVVNVKGKLFAIDASEGGIVSDDLRDYIKNTAVATTYRIVKGQFTVKEVVPKP